MTSYTLRANYFQILDEFNWNTFLKDSLEGISGFYVLIIQTCIEGEKPVDDLQLSKSYLQKNCHPAFLRKPMTSTSTMFS